MRKSKKINRLEGFAFPKIYTKAKSERRRGPGPEALLKRQILEWARMQPDLFLQTISIGMIPNSRGGWRSNPTAGCSDLLGVCHGRALALELKSKTGRLSDLQRVFLEQWEKAGGIARVIRSLDELIEIVGEIRNKSQKNPSA